MFDAIGRSPEDEEATLRSAAALAIVALLVTSCWCTLVGYGVITAVPPLPPSPKVFDDPLIALVELELEPDLAAPIGQRPPPPAAKSTAAADDGESDPEPDPTDSEVEPQTLDDPPKDEVVSQAPTVGTDDGSEDGQTDGEPGGMQGGIHGGTFGAKPCPGCRPGPVAIHASKVRIRRKVQPTYPEQARTMGLDEVVCRLQVDINEAGKPTDVEVGRCPRIFHSSAREALFAWRFYPARVNGQKVPARFTLSIRYRLRD